MTGHVPIALLILAGGVLPAGAPALAPSFWAPFVLVGDGGPTGP